VIGRPKRSRERKEKAASAERNWFVYEEGEDRKLPEKEKQVGKFHEKKGLHSTTTDSGKRKEFQREKKERTEVDIVEEKEFFERKVGKGSNEPASRLRRGGNKEGTSPQGGKTSATKKEKSLPRKNKKAEPSVRPFPLAKR